MAIIPKYQLKDLFQTGDLISQESMADLIDSAYNPTLIAGSNIFITGVDTPSGRQITISSSGGGGGGVTPPAGATTEIDKRNVTVLASETGTGGFAITEACGDFHSTSGIDLSWKDFQTGGIAQAIRINNLGITFAYNNIDTYTFPLGDGTVNQVMKTDGAGQLSWEFPSIPSIIPAYDDDTAAGTAGLATGDIYQTTGVAVNPLNVAGIMMVKQ